MNIQEFIKNHKLPTHSRIVAMQQVMEQHGDLESSEYRVRLIELTGRGDNLPDREARYTYLYVVQELLTLYLNGSDDNSDQINKAIVYATAEQKATNYIENNQHLFVEKEDVVVIDVKTGKAKQKRGAKKDKVCALWAEHKSKNMSRKEWIELLMVEVDMTKAGASTYYANLRNNEFGC